MQSDRLCRLLPEAVSCACTNKVAVQPVEEPWQILLRLREAKGTLRTGPPSRNNEAVATPCTC